jgi:FAD:protein FMN transferase
MNEICTFTRRDFLRRSAMLGLGLCAGGIAPLAAQAARLGSDGHAVSATRVMIGTIVHLTAVHPSRTLAEEGVGRAFEEMDRLAAIFDRHRPETALSTLNAQGRISSSPRELVRVMDKAVRMHALSGGAFDVTVAPVVDLFKAKSDRNGPMTLSDEELASAMDLVGSRHIRIEGRSVGFARAGMRSSLDGIAKGFIVDSASEVLSRHGIQNHLVNAGGDIRARGHNAKGLAWSVAVEDPAKQGRYPEVVRMRSGALATSGSYEVFYDTERLYHHIVSPTTGRSPNTARSVTVRAETTMEADALSTAVFVMPPVEGVAFVDSLPGRECLLIAGNGLMYRSRNWEST